MKILYLLAVLALISLSLCRNEDEWKSRTIYQLITDRFARTDGNTAICKEMRKYCGGTFQGIINNLHDVPASQTQSRQLCLDPHRKNDL